MSGKNIGKLLLSSFYYLGNMWQTDFSYLLIIYTLAIIIFYLYQHPDLTKDGSYDSVGILTKTSEIGIIALTLRKLD